MRIPIDRDSDKTLYKQIEEYFRQGIETGNLPPGFRLPATCQLASDIGVNRLTVQTAYAALEADGLTLSRTGSGTYVLPPWQIPEPVDTIPGAAWPQWHHVLSDEGENSTGLSPQVFQGVETVKDVIDFSSGLVAPELILVETFRKTLQNVMREDGIDVLLNYGDPKGYPPLRTSIAQVLTSQGIQTSSEEILITSGSQQAITLICNLLADPGDTILVSSPTYSAGLMLFQALKLNVVGVPFDRDGMQVDELERKIKQHQPKLIYTIPNFQNPTGVCMSVVRRRHLLSLADKYQVPVLEDDFVGDLRYDGHAVPALKALDPGGRVIYISTFSKMLLPSLRVGFIAAEGPFFERLAHFKHVSVLATSHLVQRALESYVTIGRYQSHLRRTRRLYRSRRDAMLVAIKMYLPPDVIFNPPQGGLFIWLKLPDGISTKELLSCAIESGIRFAPGDQFFPNASEGNSFMRLNFAASQEEAIKEGIKRLGEVIKRFSMT